MAKYSKGKHTNIIYDYQHLLKWAKQNKYSTRRLKTLWRRAVAYGHVKAHRQVTQFLGKGAIKKFAYKTIQKSLEKQIKIGYVGKPSLMRLQAEKNDIHRLDNFMRGYTDEQGVYHPGYGDEILIEDFKPWDESMITKFKNDYGIDLNDYKNMKMKDIWQLWKDNKIEDKAFYEMLRIFQRHNTQYVLRAPVYEARKNIYGD